MTFSNLQFYFCKWLCRYT